MIISPYIVPGLKYVPVKCASLKQQEIINTITDFMEVPFSQLIPKNRQRKIVDTRRLIMYFLRRAGFTLAEIGKLFKQDHTTVIHAINTLKDLMFSDPVTKFRVQYIRDKIEA